jgi:hypothetical protein
MRKMIRFGVLLIGLINLNHNVSSQNLYKKYNKKTFHKYNKKAFQKGSKNIDLGVGFGTYLLTSILKNDILNPQSAIVTFDESVKAILDLNVEYGISNKFGIGAQVGYSKFLFYNDNFIRAKLSLSSVDFAVKLNYHLNEGKNDLFFGVGLGGTSLKRTGLATENFNGLGLSLSAHISDRIFFNEQFGILFNLGYSSYFYSNLIFSNNDKVSNLKWNLDGINVGSGLVVKL